MIQAIVRNSFLQITLILLTLKSAGQNNQAAIAAADTTRFSVDLNSGWQMYNSYVAPYHTDSAQLELILQHNNNINWYQQQYVGKIKYSPLLPNADRNIVFNLLGSSYRIVIKKNGKCYIYFVSGTQPASNPAVIPLKVFYKL